MSSTKSRIEVDVMVEAGGWPAEPQLRDLVDRAIASLEAAGVLGAGTTELSVVFSDDRRVRELNAAWRGKDRPTNVLSFPAFATPGRGAALPPMLGDIVLAFETAAGEARLEGKTLEHHISHLVLHGLLHLLGYDHEQDAEADEMEAIETGALARLAIPDPYA
jgi:probable rRNA maturation factor